MFEEHIDVIQSPSGFGNLNPAPLVLFHDGGGTIFSYHMLGDLRRPVYGIANPHWGKETCFEGGMPEMARVYVDLMRKAVPSGKIIIGGWSLGGLTSIEVARILADDKQFEVIGIVMIDSVCPLAYNVPPDAFLKIVPHVVEWSDNTREETRQAVLKCFADATTMVGAWKLPAWDDQQITGRSALRPPPVILLKAKEPVPVLEEGVSRVDVVRGDRKLGWDMYLDGLVEKVVDIPGHHYNVFVTEWRLEIITDRLKRACLDIEKIHRLRRT
ncbi:alpha/beta-hydrolase [Rhypophila sp. PSN 637]